MISDFNHGVLIGARWGGLNISETDDLWGFSHKPFLEFAQNGAKKKKHPVSGSSVGRNASWIRDKKAAVSQVITL